MSTEWIVNELQTQSMGAPNQFLLSYGLTLISTWISNYIHYKVWNQISYPFPNLHAAAIEVCEWINNFIPH